MQEEIEKVRGEIDKIDEDIVRLLSARAEKSIEIGTIKKSDPENSKEIFDPTREEKVLKKVISLSNGVLKERHCRAIYKEIFSASRDLQKPVKISFLGPKTTFTHQAAVEKFGHSCDFQRQSSINAVFASVEKGESDFGVVPIENSIEGVVNPTLDAFIDSSLHIVDEIKMSIRLHLMSQSESMGEIKAIFSHPQPFGQCRNWLFNNLPNIEQIVTSSTAEAARMASEHAKNAAIAGSLSAEAYNLNILAHNIQDQAENFTRFLFIGKSAGERADKNKTSILFSIKDEAGSLLNALQLFASNQINLTKIQSRPLRNRPWEYLFFVDFDGHADDPPIQKVLETLKKQSLFLKVLGSYPRKV